MEQANDRGVIVASLRFFKRILWMFLPTGVAFSEVIAGFIEASVIVLVETELGRVVGFLGLSGIAPPLVIWLTICCFYRLEGRNIFPIFWRKELPARPPLVFPV